jgi:hypothetical protein
VAIYRLIARGSFDPDQIEAMTAAYELALADMKLVSRSDPLTEMIATSIIAVTSRGERDVNKIKERALHALGAMKPSAA